jgi:hypothetical protein
MNVYSVLTGSFGFSTCHRDGLLHREQYWHQARCKDRHFGTLALWHLRLSSERALQCLLRCLENWAEGSGGGGEK